MSNGQILFFSGVALMAATILLAVFFLIKKPKYEPTKAVYQEAEERENQRLRSGHATARTAQMRRNQTPKKDTNTGRGKVPAAEPQNWQKELPQTQILQQPQGETLRPAAVKKTEALKRFSQETVLLSEKDLLTRSGAAVSQADVPGVEMGGTESSGKGGEYEDA